MRSVGPVRTKLRSTRAALAVLAAVVLLSVGLSSCSSTVGYAAIVNGTVISQSTVNHLLAEIASNKNYLKQDVEQGDPPVMGTTAGSYNPAYVSSVLLQELIQQALIHHVVAAAKALPTASQISSTKSEVSPEFVSQDYPSGTFGGFPSSYQQLLESQQADIDAFVKVETRSLSAAAMTEYYKAHLTAYANEWCVRYIAIADKASSGQTDNKASLADAQRIKGLIDAGGNFAALANEYSEANQGSNNGGVLTGSAPDGCLTTNDLNNLGNMPFVDAVLSLPTNVVSSPVSLPTGYALVEVTSRVIEALDGTVTMDIRERLAGQQYNRLIAAAKVKVNPEFGSFSNKLGSSGEIIGMVPPAVPSLGTTTTAPASSVSSGSSGSTSGG